MLWPDLSTPSFSCFINTCGFDSPPLPPVFTACQGGDSPAMAQQDAPANKAAAPNLAVLHSNFIIGSVSEENSEDEFLGKPDLTLGLEEKERSISPTSSLSSENSSYEMGFDNIDGLHMRSEPGLFFLVCFT